MMTPEQNGIDAWTGMPIELDASAAASIEASTSLPPKSARFDIKGLFWKYIASGSETTPTEVLTCLATDERINIRRRVAENSGTPDEALVLLADDVSASVRAAVARNPQTPVYVLRKLAQDDDVEVRFAIASNPEMPDAILLSLFMDPDPYVAERASQTLAA